MYGIARHYEISLDNLRTVNKLPENFVLKEGFILKIPSSGKASAPQVPEIVIGNESGGQLTGIEEPRKTTVKNIDPAIRWPVNAREIAYTSGKLYGVVILGEKSESIKSLSQGTVVSAGPYRGFGKVVIVQRTGGYLYVYGGCESISVKEGDRVAPGMELGKLGIDPVTIKPQLFFLVQYNNSLQDPAKAPRN